MHQKLFAFALAAPVMTLRHFGLNAELIETNEIEVDGKRIAGTGGGLIGNAAVVVGNLLFDFDFDTMAAVWNTPSSSFRTLAQKALKDHIVTVNDLSSRVTIEEATKLLVTNFAETMERPLSKGVLSLEEIGAAAEMAEELGSPDFLGLHKGDNDAEPIRALKISARACIRYDETSLKGCNVRGSFWLSGNLIREVKFESTPDQDWNSEELKLQGTLFESWKERFC